MNLWVWGIPRGPSGWVSGAPERGWSAAGWLRPPVVYVAGRPRAALLFWFFGDFRCGAWLVMVIHVIYKYKNR